MKRVLFLFCTPLLVALLLSYTFFFLVAEEISDHFHPHKIKAPLQMEKAALLPKGLGDTFFYLGRGSQSFVFENEQKTYVIKFIRMNRYHVGNMPYLPSYFQKKWQCRKEKKTEKFKALLQSCEIGARALRNETQIVYLHLFKSENLHKQILVYDALMRSQVLSLDECAFIIQRKAEWLYPYLKKLLDKRDLAGVKSALESLKALLCSRFAAGIADHDPVIEKNVGFIEGRAIFIDTGEFYIDEQIKDPHIYRLEGEKIVAKLKGWLEKQDPKYANLYLDVLKF